ncbi:hypothetical protein [Kordiimonas aestuarii]|uniref:hypothetical protein n=1 Tax=Kordiimonas aestuarii TaxID=1005925 RepID=UPI0021D2B151|nr:hypothetical protein [Kordiimonas aestuarii]
MRGRFGLFARGTQGLFNLHLVGHIDENQLPRLFPVPFHRARGKVKPARPVASQVDLMPVDNGSFSSGIKEVCRDVGQNIGKMTAGRPHVFESFVVKENIGVGGDAHRLR